MKFCTSVVTTATAIIAFFGAPVSSKKRFSKSGGGASLPLEPYRYFEPADFEGSYKTCFATVIRNSSPPRFDGTYHLCEGDPITVSLQNFTKTDDYGGYQSTSVLSGGVPEIGKSDLGSFQGIANGNTLPMAAFGVGIYNPAGQHNEFQPDLIPNNTPDRRTCTMFADNVMECASFFTEYCNGVLENGTSPCVDGQQWLNTYAIEEILVLDGEECPEAPAGFCESNRIVFPSFPSRRGLRDESGSAKKTPCPFLAGKMDE